MVRVDILARSTQDRMYIFDSVDTDDNTKKGTLAKDAAMGNLLRGQLTAGLPAKPDGELKLFLDTKAITDLWIAVTWSK